MSDVMVTQSVTCMDDRAVTIQSAEAVERRCLAWDGMMAEAVRLTHRERIDLRFRAPVHLLAFCEQGVRREGCSVIEGLAPSRRHDVARKFTFVPAGRAYNEWHQPGVLARFVFLYLDPARLPQPDAAAPLLPRLLFEDEGLLDTVVKFRKAIETPESQDASYLKALATVLLHELAHLETERPARGGLAAWQQREVKAYIEEHLAEPIPIGALAQLADLSPHHFCRAFRQSFGMPPHRYHNSLRIERAKELLARPAPSVTAIGLELGFSGTSSFSTMFHKLAGQTPTSFRRSLMELNASA